MYVGVGVGGELFSKMEPLQNGSRAGTRAVAAVHL